ncbi:hypothetical protein IFR05_006250 [Cadophora sp. M221]|nr:hypothetical protein IFR05_006250 [Cadophora sp. M221]
MLQFVINSNVTIIPPTEFRQDETYKVLGSGATMTLMERYWVLKKQAVAIKQLKFKFPATANDKSARPENEKRLLESFTLELRALCHGALGNHPNIVQILGVTWAEKDLPAVVVEKAMDLHPTLDDVLDKRVLKGTEKAEILAGITDGLFAIHNLSIIHGDIKPANILIFSGITGLDLVPKLSDFAFSHTSKEKKSSGGTDYWNAPECSRHLKKAPESIGGSRDIFSLGLVFWNVLYYERPFKDIGDERDVSDENQQRILRAKVSGFLIEKIKDNPMDTSWMFKEGGIMEDDDDAECELAICEITGTMLHPMPANRKFVIYPGQKLRERSRLMDKITVVWNGEKLVEKGDSVPCMKAEVEELRAKMTQMDMMEKSIRMNVQKSLKSDDAPEKADDWLEVDSPPDVIQKLREHHQAVLRDPDSQREDQAASAWSLSQYHTREVNRDLKLARGFCLKAALLGHSGAKINYLYSCMRDEVVIEVDARTEVTWIVESLTSDHTFKVFEFDFRPQEIRSRLNTGFEKYFSAVDPEDCKLILRAVFVNDILGASYASPDTVFTNGKWGTLTTAQEKKFEEFRKGFGDMENNIEEDTLHEVAVFGNGDVIRELVQKHNVDVDSVPRGGSYAGKLQFKQHSNVITLTPGHFCGVPD